ncbi:SRPBCC family protein [Hyunsoonleella rubra]|uniref:Cell division protein n=1 Tax=Hyunsoonleella rubra TaxID=1737062 RepID=A0ABW5TCS2_9FLAO
MSHITIRTEIIADIKICFNLARSIDFHKESLKHTGEIPVAGKTTGMVELGEWVSWEAKHLGFVQHFTTKVTAFESPNLFIVEMVFGAFKSYLHEHRFYKEGQKTIMVQKMFFETPYGILGKLFNSIFLKGYMSRLIKTRNAALKVRAESMHMENVLGAKSRDFQKHILQF